MAAWAAWAPAPASRSAWAVVCSEARCSARRLVEAAATVVAAEEVDAAAAAVAAAAVEPAQCAQHAWVISHRRDSLLMAMMP